MLFLLQLQRKVSGEWDVWVERDVNQAVSTAVVSVENGKGCEWDGDWCLHHVEGGGNVGERCVGCGDRWGERWGQVSITVLLEGVGTKVKLRTQSRCR